MSKEVKEAISQIEIAVKLLEIEKEDGNRRRKIP